MNIKHFITALLLLAITATACKKDGNGPDDFVGTGTLTMKAGGVEREANSAFVFTAHEPEEDHYVVAITGFFTSEGHSDNDEVGDAIHLYMAMTGAQFNNPKGTYDVVAIDSDIENQPLVYGLYQVKLGAEDGRTYGIVDANHTVGKLTITDFSIGNQTGIPGISGRGYTKLQGTFHMNLTEVRTDGTGIGDVLAITDGKFNVKDGLGFGF